MIASMAVTTLQLKSTVPLVYELGKQVVLVCCLDSMYCVSCFDLYTAVTAMMGNHIFAQNKSRCHKYSLSSICALFLR